MYHNPVMLNECIEALNINPDGTYVDVTYGGGGHSQALLARLNNGRLLAFDQDMQAHDQKINDTRLTLIHANFKHLKRFLQFHKAFPVDGILADLGISSHQIDCAERGFSTRYDAGLDMRMNPEKGISAAEVLNQSAEKELSRIFWEYGELKNGRKIAETIVKKRQEKPIETTFQLIDILKPFAPKFQENKFFAVVFQSLRIEVNQELEALRTFLPQTPEALKSGGRLVVMSYHSLEDRLVKNFMKSGNFEGEIEKDFYGNPLTPFKKITGKPIVASEEEVQTNPRARSAKLRIAEKK